MSRAKNEWRFEKDAAIGKCVNTGAEFIVDIDDYESVRQYGWWEMSNGYIVFQSSDNVAILLHRLVIGAKKGEVVDHINHDKKDNRKSNLRTANQECNMMNASARKDNTSGHTGVWKDNRTGKWVAEIRAHKKKINLGHYATLNDAVAARKRGEQKYFGDWAYSNSIDIQGVAR